MRDDVGYGMWSPLCLVASIAQSSVTKNGITVEHKILLTFNFTENLFLVRVADNDDAELPSCSQLDRLCPLLFKYNQLPSGLDAGCLCRLE